MRGINTFTLKMLALLAMLCDHVGHAFFPQVAILRMVGRISFPIFAYVLVESFFYTRDVKKYLLRLGVMALVSEIPFDLVTSKKMLELGHQNIFFTLFIGVLTMYFVSRTVNPILQFSYVAVAMMASEILRVDYRYYGILIILWFYYWRSNKWIKYVGTGIIMILLRGVSGVFASCALIPIALHNGKQGWKCKWFFYLFYPVHLLAIGLIALTI